MTSRTPDRCAPAAGAHLRADRIAARHDALRQRLRHAAERAGRDPDGFAVVAVTKTFPIEVVRAAREAGLTRLGENRVQEALPKIEAVPDAEWHLVGHLQSNKVRRAVESFDLIHSVDSATLLRRIDAVAHDLGRRPRLLLQANLTGEASKSGLAPDDLSDPDLLAAVAQLESASLIGLMVIARQGAPALPVFARLRELRDELEQRAGIGLPELSMGMSGDAEEAVAEGSTLVRIGTALFGPRPV